MRRLILGLAMLALLWCGWWAVAAFGLSSGAQAWFDARRGEGWQADLDGVDTGGFPNRITADLIAPALADPDTGLALSMDRLTLSARAAWPGDVAVMLPDTPIAIATPQGRWSVLVSEARADMNLHPGTALELEAMGASSAAFRVEDARGQSLFGAWDLTLTLSQGDVPERYALSFDVTEFTPGEAPRRALSLPDDWPLVFDVLTARASVQFDRPLDRRTLEDRRPQPQQILLDRIEARWGDMTFLATGTLTADANRRAQGELVIKAENWQRMLDAAELAGILPPEFRPQAESVLSSLAAGTGRTDELDLTLRFDGGLTRLGFLPLGPAPLMVLR